MIPELYRKRTGLVNHMGLQLRRHRLALVVGAGISQPFGLPDWPELTKRAAASLRIRFLTDSDPESRAETLRSAATSTAHFVDLVSKALYKRKIDWAKVHRDATLDAIAALAVPSIRGKLTSIFTLNFDDLLDRHLAFHGAVVHPVVVENDRGGAVDAAVFHPHGFLPSPGSPFAKWRSEDIILDQWSFAKALEERNGWWTGEMEHAMLCNFVLFLGISGKDKRLDSLAAAVHERNYFIGSGEPYWGAIIKEKPTTSEVQKWKKRGIVVVPVTKYEHGQPEFLLEICRAAARI